jgi:hypothetical protein
VTGSTISGRLYWHRERLDLLRERRAAADATGDEAEMLAARRDLLRALVREHVSGGGLRELMRVLWGLDHLVADYWDALGPDGVDALIDCFDYPLDRRLEALA